ncbi:hypothetical protein Tco_1135857 [Tanacetum coccineum]
MFTYTLAQYMAHKTNVAQQFTPQKHYRLSHPGQGILGSTPAIYVSQPTTLPSAFSIMPSQDPTWHMDTCASSHLNFNASNLSTIFDKGLFPSVHISDGKSIPVTNTGHNIIPSYHHPLHLHNVLVTPNIIKNLISVRQFTRDNNCTIEFDAFGFSVKDYLTRHILLRCDSSVDLYPVTKPSTPPISFLLTSASTWHQRLGHPDTVMSNSKDSTVTYTAVSNPFRGLSNIGSPGVVGPEHEGLPWMLDNPYVQVALQAPPSPDYIPGPEEPQSPPPPDFVPEIVYPEFMPPKDEIIPVEEQPLPVANSPTADSPGYIPESNPEEDPEEDDDKDPEEDPADYPADGGDDGDDEDVPSDDDEDEEVDIEADDEEEEEHPAHADSTAVALPAVDQAASAEETKPFETDKSAATPPPHPAYRVTARISIRDETPISLHPREEVERLLAMPTPPSSPLSLWSPPLPQIPSPPLPPILSPLPVSPSLPQISLPPLPVSSPIPVLSPSLPASPICPLGYQAVMIRLRAEAASTSHSLPLPPPIILSHTRPDAPSSGIPPLHLLSTDPRADRPEVTLPPRKRLGIALGPRYEIRESSSAIAARPAGGLKAYYGFVATIDREIRRDLERDVGYGITDSWDEIVEATQGTLVVTDVAEFSQRMTEFETRVRQDTDEIYTRDRHAHARTARLMQAEAKIYREAWGRSMDVSDLVRTKVMSLHTQVVAQQAMITELQAADRRRHAVITKMLAADHMRQKQFIEAPKLLK